MKYILAVALSLLLANTVTAEKSKVVVTAADYSCSDLQEIVDVHGVVFVEGLGSRNVYSKAEDACFGEGHDEDTGYWFQTYWDTNDGVVCRVGFGCRAYRDGNDNDQGDDIDDGELPDNKQTN